LSSRWFSVLPSFRTEIHIKKKTLFFWNKKKKPLVYTLCRRWICKRQTDNICDARILHLRESTGIGYVPISISDIYPYLNLFPYTYICIPYQYLYRVPVPYPHLCTIGQYAMPFLLTSTNNIWINCVFVIFFLPFHNYFPNSNFIIHRINHPLQPFSIPNSIHFFLFSGSFYTFSSSLQLVQFYLFLVFSSLLMLYVDLHLTMFFLILCLLFYISSIWTSRQFCPSTTYYSTLT
jgi:hypothetical protein